MTAGELGVDAVSEEVLILESFEELYENAPCGLLSLTLDGTILRINRTLLEWTGYDLDDLLGASVMVLLSPGSRLFWETRFVPVLRLEGVAREIALELHRADGTSLHVLTNSSVVTFADGAAPIVRTAVFDSTERSNYERELVGARRRAEASEVRLRVLQDAAGALAQCASVEAVAEALVDSARAAFSTTEASVLLLSEADELYVAAGVHPLLEFLPADTLKNGSEAIRIDDIFMLRSVEEASSFSDTVAKSMQSARIRAITATPIQSEGSIFGVLHCSFSRPRDFDQAYRQLNYALTLQAGQVIARLRLVELLAREALHDQLTGLANRTLLQDRMDEAISGAQRSSRPVSVLFVDLDGFKAVNDHLGHVIGDSALREVAARLRDVVRATDVVGRFGGDEFIVVCPDADEDAATAVAERIRASVAKPLDRVLEQYRVTASVGIALWEPKGTEIVADALFRAADEAMYRSKNAGKDCVTLVRV